MFNQKDTNQILQRGATVRGVEEQIEHFKKGFPWMKIVGPATPHRGIRVLTEAEADAAIRYYEGAEIAGKCKFVPASGAASRMFKDIFAGLATLEKGEDLPADAAGAKLAAQIDKFAFYTKELFGEKEDTAAYRKSVLAKVLTDEGLGYGAKPKGVIKFHRRSTSWRPRPTCATPTAPATWSSPSPRSTSPSSRRPSPRSSPCSRPATA